MRHADFSSHRPEIVKDFASVNGTPNAIEEGMTKTTTTVGDFIRIPAWRTEGQVIATRPPMMGSDDAIDVLLEARPDDTRPRWYRLEPNEFEVIA